MYKCYELFPLLVWYLRKSNTESRIRAKKQQWKMETFARAAQEYCASKKRSLPVTGLCNMGTQPILIPQTSGR